jgi:hypothetical protein
MSLSVGWTIGLRLSLQTKFHHKYPAKSPYRPSIWKFAVWSRLSKRIKGCDRYEAMKLKLKLNYDRQSVVQSVLMSGSHLEPMTRFVFSVWQMLVSCCVASSLTRRWVCNLLAQLLLGLARAVTLGSKSRRTHYHILLSLLRLPKPGEPGPSIYIPLEQGSLVIPPGTGFHFHRLLNMKQW